MNGRFAFSCCLLLLSALSHAASAFPDGRQILDHDGRQRGYLLRLPAALKMDGPRLPLVIVLHGGGGNGANAERMTGFTELAQREGFIVAYPDGSGRRQDKLLTWNAGHCCGYAMREGVDDVGFIAALIDKLVAEDRVDAQRVYITGMSNGALMTHRLGIELSGRVAAIAPVVGTLFGDERRAARAVPALIFNGALDRNVPPAGGKPGGRFGSLAWDDMALLPATAQSRYWADANGCAPQPQLTDGADYELREYVCPAGSEVLSYLVKNNGHAWPGGERGSRMGDEPNPAVQATEIMWRFFSAHAKNQVPIK